MELKTNAALSTIDDMQLNAEKSIDNKAKIVKNPKKPRKKK